ncbi:MAG: hypothetical protein ACI9MC_000317 [Kiritimatiellia bacterium]|jgi:hypothetical protein
MMRSLQVRMGPILAIAWRDLSQQFRGRRGWSLPLITALLLLPLSLISFGGRDARPRTGPLAGEVPEVVRALGDVGAGPGGLVFLTEGDVTVVMGESVPAEVRAALDRDPPVVTISSVPLYDMPLPGRTLLLTLLASSLVMGPVAESMAGERGRGTLQALLTAAVTRTDIVLGKWLAWGIYSALGAGAAASLSMVAGVQPVGWWPIPLPTVPLCTVALGLYLTRGARDLVGGATVSLRVLPAILSGLALVAWFLGLIDPILGASVPLGGALVAAGGTWDGPAPALVATAVTLSVTGLLIVLTSRDLGRASRSAGSRGGWRSGLIALAWAAAAWWATMGGPVLWGLAGNNALTRELPYVPTLISGSLTICVLVAVEAARAPSPGRALGLVRVAGWQPWLAAVIAGVVIAALGWTLGPSSAEVGSLQARLAMGLTPLDAGVGVGLLVVVAQELLFRGWLQRAFGPVGATLAFVVVVAPFDPLMGVILGGLLAVVSTLSRGSVWPSIFTRVLAGLLLLSLRVWM